jgi:hypothetical protein
VVLWLGLGARGGLVLFRGYLAYMVGKKRHHQAMGGGMVMGLQISKIQSVVGFWVANFYLGNRRI